MKSSVALDSRPPGRGGCAQKPSRDVPRRTPDGAWRQREISRNDGRFYAGALPSVTPTMALCKIATIVVSSGALVERGGTNARTLPSGLIRSPP